jgi:transcriptional regulator with XRE-family HTH domain
VKKAMNKEALERCSERIAKALSIRNMKQSELCERTKIPKSAISQYLSGAFEPKQDRLHIMAKALDVDPVWLMGYDVPMEKEEKTSPNEPKLTEGEKVWLDLYHQLSKETRAVLVNMAEAFENLPTDRQQFLLDAVRVLNNQK